MKRQLRGSENNQENYFSRGKRWFSDISKLYEDKLHTYSDKRTIKRYILMRRENSDRKYLNTAVSTKIDKLLVNGNRYWHVFLSENNKKKNPQEICDSGG